MSIRLEYFGAPEIAAPRATVWQRLVDLPFVTQSTPAVESTRLTDSGGYQVASALKMGPIKVRLVTDVELSDLVEGQRARLRTRTDASGSTVDVVTAVRLEDISADRTVLHWAATAEVDGALAGLGAGMMEGFLQKLTSNFWVDFAQRVEERPVR